MPASSRWVCFRASAGAACLHAYAGAPNKNAPGVTARPAPANGWRGTVRTHGVDLDSNAVVIADATGVIRFWSAGAEKAFGYATGQAVGRTLDLIVPPEYRQAHWNGFRRAIASGAAAVEGQSVPFPVRRADGNISAASGRLTLLRDPHGQVIAAAVAFERLPGAYNNPAAEPNGGQ